VTEAATCEECGQDVHAWELTVDGGWRPLDANGREHRQTCRAWRRFTAPGRCGHCGGRAAEHRVCDRCVGRDLVELERLEQDLVELELEGP